VDPEESPIYHDVIEHPMDFDTVRRKLARNTYCSFEQFEVGSKRCCKPSCGLNPLPSSLRSPPNWRCKPPRSAAMPRLMVAARVMRGRPGRVEEGARTVGVAVGEAAGKGPAPGQCLWR